MPKKKTKKITAGVFDQFNWGESYTSLIMGAIVVIVAGILFISFARNHKTGQVSSIKDESKIEKQKLDNQNVSSTYTIKPGDDLWSISEQVYKTGYRWIEIAKVNRLENPGLIHPGNILMLPNDMQDNIVAIKSEVPVEKSDKIIVSNSITNDTYAIKKGDNLWDIAVRAYGDGFRYTDIAKANNLENPSLIFSDNILKIPR